MLTAMVFVFAIFIYGKYWKDIVNKLSFGKNKISQTVNTDGRLLEKNLAATPSPSKTSVITSLASMAIYNGTEKIGLSGKFANWLLEKYKADIVTKQNASKRDYPRSFVVVVRENGLVLARKIAFDLDIPLVNIMPDRETTPSADILVILGGDYR